MGIEIHKNIVETAKNSLINDVRFLGMAIGGSWMDNTLDEFSDLDFYLILDHDYNNLSFEDKKIICAGWGDLLSFYINGHDDNVTVSLFNFNPYLLHVDCKWVGLEGLKERVENPQIIFERKGLLTKIIMDFPSHGYDMPNFNINEMRFWTWMHYVLSKLGRGEILEAYDYLCEVRSCCLGPMVLYKNNMPPRRMRHAEELPTEEYNKILKTIPEQYNAQNIYYAVISMIELYIETRDSLSEFYESFNLKAEKACLKYAEYIKNRIHNQ